MCIFDISTHCIRCIHHIFDYGLATISRLLNIIGLFCKRALLKRLYSAKETCKFKEHTNRSHPIVARTSCTILHICHAWIMFLKSIWIRVDTMRVWATVCVYEQACACMSKCVHVWAAVCLQPQQPTPSYLYSKEPYIPAKELSVSTKEPYKFSKETASWYNGASSVATEPFHTLIEKT